MQPEAALELGGRKAERVLEVEPDAYAAANPGCLVQVSAALRRAGSPFPALHPVELLDASLRGVEAGRAAGAGSPLTQAAPPWGQVLRCRIRMGNCAESAKIQARSLAAAFCCSSLAQMARPLRICLPGGVYHVIARGNGRATIYRDDADRFRFLRTLGHVVDRFGWLCHAYCLMGNHYHLVVETPRSNLPTGMQQLNGPYAQRFNERHGRCGHVFQARYRSILVEKESHLLALCRYIVLNPVRAGLCARPRAYHWSSYRATAGQAPVERFLVTDWILGCFAGSRALAQARYRAFVANGDPKSLGGQVRGERLGSTALLEERFGHEPPLAEIPRVQIEPLPPTLAEVFACDPDAPVSTAYRRHGYTLRAIAEHLGCHYSTVSRRLRREEAGA